MTAWLALASLIVATTTVAATSLGARPALAQTTASGRGVGPVPPGPGVPETWTATDIEGRRWSGSALRGRVVLIDFWATWCAPCLDDLPRLRRLHARHATGGLTIIGVSLDRSTLRDFRSWLQRQAIAWPQVREIGMYDSPLARAFDVQAIPASFLFDRQGRLQAASLRGEALDARVSALMETR